jgi:hypothetical protein
MYTYYGLQLICASHVLLRWSCNDSHDNKSKHHDVYHVKPYKKTVAKQACTQHRDKRHHSNTVGKSIGISPVVYIATQQQS